MEMNLQLERSSNEPNFQIKYMTGLGKALKPELNIWVRIDAKQETWKPSAESDWRLRTERIGRSLQYLPIHNYTDYNC